MEHKHCLNYLNGGTVDWYKSPIASSEFANNGSVMGCCVMTQSVITWTNSDLSQTKFPDIDMEMISYILNDQDINQSNIFGYCTFSIRNHLAGVQKKERNLE